MSHPGDAAEMEADHVAHAVTGMTTHAAHAGATPSGPLVQRAPGRATGPARVPAHVESHIATMRGGGRPLEPATRKFFEPRFGSDFRAVRAHTGPDAARAAGALGARAFTLGQQIFFGKGQYQPESPAGRHLIAHELTHTIQQKPKGARIARFMEVATQVQGDWPDVMGSALAQLRTWAEELPPYELLTVLLGKDPITDQAVARTPQSFIRAALKLVPDGMAIYADLEKNNTIDEVAKWFDAEVAKLNLTWDGVKALFVQVGSSLGLLDLTPGGIWEKVKAAFGPTLNRVWEFAKAVGEKILDFLKKAVLGKLGAWAKEQRGYSLFTVILAKDPVTGEAVERTPKTFVKAVLDLVDGGDKIYDNIEKSKTIEKAVSWFNAEVGKLDLSWDKIKDLFGKAWDALKATDLLNPLGVIEKIAGVFLPPVKRIIDFTVAAGKKVLEFIFEGAMALAGPIGQQIVSIVHKVGDTFNKIVQDPVKFAENLVHAVKVGFQQFGQNIWEHLKNGLIAWLVGTLEGAGLVLPKVWDLKGIVSVVLQVLGISYSKIRAKLVKIIGEERMAMLERVFGFIKTLVTEGPAAAWQQIVAAIGSLWDMVIGGIKDWAVTKIVTAAITKLVTMFNPAGAVIQAIIAVYNTIAFFIERIKQILALVDSIVDSIANIAAGKISAAANYVEQAMARTIPVILGFLARLIGLGDVSGAVKKVITAIQDKVDKGIDAVIKWVVDKAKSLLAAGKGFVEGGKAWAKKKWEGMRGTFTFEGDEHSLIVTEEDKPRLVIASEPEDARARMAKEVEVAKESGDSDRLEQAQRIHDALADLALQLSDPSTQDPSKKAAFKAQFSGVLRAIKDYGSKYRRRGLLPEDGTIQEGLIRPYNQQPSGGAGKIEREHIIPGALFAAWFGLKRGDPVIATLYGNMTTLTWKWKAARIKTASDAAKWNAMNAVRDKWLAQQRVGGDTMPQGKIRNGPLPKPEELFGSLRAIKDDRVSASKAAATQAESKVTPQDIEQAASLQYQEIDAVQTQMRQLANEGS